MLIARACIIASAIACYAISDASAQQRREREWVSLGCYEIRNQIQEAGLIRVDIGNRRVSAIRLSASGSTVRIVEAKVTTPTGNSEYLPLEAIRISSGSRTEALDLEGNARELREIEIIFQSTAVSPGRRTLCAEGQVVTGPAERNWVEVGCHTVDFSSDVDRFRVANQTGSIEAVRLNVRDNDVQVMSFTARYFDGSSEKLTVDPPYIQRDRRSRRINLNQGPQRIREIELFYFSIPNISGKAVVCVEAQIVPTPPPRDIPDISNLPNPETGWERFSCQVIDTTGGAVKINVGRPKGRFSAVQVQAFQNSLRIEKLDIIPVRAAVGRQHWDGFWVRKDAVSNPLAFRDRAHRIEAIEVTFRSAEGSGGQAILCVNGQTADNSPIYEQEDNQERQATWQIIGCQPVQASRETDVYQVGRDERTYRAIRFQARDNDVNLLAITIRYIDGGFERYAMSDNVIRRDSRTRQYTLGDDRRVIDKIDLTYETVSGYRRNDALLCIEGLPGRARDNDGNRVRRDPVDFRR